MPDSWQFLLLFGSNAVGWALACAYMLKSRKWERSYHGALRQYEGLLSAVKAPTPHQRAAETRRRKRVDEMRAHRVAMEADINRRKIMAGAHVAADGPAMRVDMTRAGGSWTAQISGPNGCRTVAADEDGCVRLNPGEFVSLIGEGSPLSVLEQLAIIGKPSL